MATYETLFITPPTLTEEDEQAIVETMAQIVTDGGGAFTVNERMGRRRLAYPIRKFEDGVYTRFLYDSDSAVAQELERRIRLSDKVLRSLTVRLEDEWAGEAKEQAKRDVQRRIEEEARRREEEAQREAAEKAAAEARAAEEAAKPAPESGTPEAEAEASDVVETAAETATESGSASEDADATGDGAGESADAESKE